MILCFYIWFSAHRSLHGCFRSHKLYVSSNMTFSHKALGTASWKVVTSPPPFPPKHPAVCFSKLFSGLKWLCSFIRSCIYFRLLFPKCAHYASRCPIYMFSVTWLAPSKEGNCQDLANTTPLSLHSILLVRHEYKNDEGQIPILKWVTVPWSLGYLWAIVTWVEIDRGSCPGSHVHVWILGNTAPIDNLCC